MSEASLLSEEELDALRGTGEADAASAPSGGGDQRPYDFRDPSRVLNGRLPGLEAVHDAFAAGMRVALRSLLGRPVEIDVGETNLTRLGDYQQTLPMPVSAHSATVHGREQCMFLVADGALVYACVDAFFGGRGGEGPATDRELSASERRLTSVLARHVFEELKNAWAPICALKFGEPQTTKATALGGLREDQIMVVSRFNVDLLPGGGDFHLSLPYGLLDSLRGFLTSGPRSEDATRQWSARFKDRVSEVEVEARAVFPGVRVSFSELMNMQAGDFIPMNRNNRVSVVVGDRVLYTAEPGTSNGQVAAKIVGIGEPGR